MRLWAGMLAIAVGACAQTPPPAPPPPKIVVIPAPPVVQHITHPRKMTKRERHILDQINQDIARLMRSESQNEQDRAKVDQEIEYLNKYLGTGDPRTAPPSQQPEGPT